MARCEAGEDVGVAIAIDDGGGDRLTVEGPDDRALTFDVENIVGERNGARPGEAGKTFALGQSPTAEQAQV